MVKKMTKRKKKPSTLEFVPDRYLYRIRHVCFQIEHRPGSGIRWQEAKEMMS
tara:strand:- start:94 stop:249 length:156 start_codon:yes stop_codon:yes gene_type:complete